ncbi:MAG TPA: type VI secretion system-associated protein TagF [Paenalcaligenes sp.]|nr:type VI secretion system-associated protein TagF [Paenalcaligenes sp.]
MQRLSIDELYEGLGWYGKLMAAGDFVHRRLDNALLNFWYQWLSQSLQQQKNLLRQAPAQYKQAPVWNFVLPAALSPDKEQLQIGCIAPSQDRVGRQFPLLISLAVPAEHYDPQLLKGSARYLQTMGKLLVVATQQGCSVQQFDLAVLEAQACITPMLQQPEPVTQGDDAILSILNFGHENPPVARIEEEQLAWPELPQCFHPYSHNSYWWTNQATGAAHRALVHAGAPTSSLFGRLFLGQA